MEMESYLAFTAEMLADFDDAGFVEALLDILHQRRNRANPQIAFHPTVLARLKRLQATDAMRFHGHFAMALKARRRTLYVEVIQALHGVPAPQGNGTARRIKASDLMRLTLPPLLYVVEDILPAGATLLTGKSKDGKSLMAYNLAVAVASGGVALGQYAVAQGSVWYLALEDGERRAQARIQAQIDNDPRGEEGLEWLDVQLWEARRLTQGLEDEMIQWILETERPRLIILDILEKVRPPRKPHGNLYEEDYQATASVTRLAQEHNVAVLIVHHSNKSNPLDFRDSASGSMSLLGGVDNYWSLSRTALHSDATLRITGRDIEREQELAMEFKDGFWSVLGNAAEVHQSRERKAIVEVLQASSRPMTPAHIAKELQKNVSTINRLLRMMIDVGAILQPYAGHYAAKLPL